MDFEIVTDSSANLTDEVIGRYGLHIISLMFLVGKQEMYSYVKGEKTDIKRFYDRMRGGEMITTSHVSPHACREVFEGILSQGKDVLYIGFSSALSGTYNAAAGVARELREEYPERKVYTVDSLAASMGEGLLVYHAAELRRQGRTIGEVKAWLEENRLHLCHWFTVDDLMFLKRGGRVSAATAIVGTIMGIKPIMHVDDEGRLTAVGKIRGRKKSIEALYEHMKNTVVDPASQVVFISHGDCAEDAEYLKNLIRDGLHVREVLINYVDPVIGAHSGPGTLALFFLGTKR